MKNLLTTENDTYIYEKYNRKRKIKYGKIGDKDL